MKRFVIQLAVVTVLMTFALSVSSIVHAANDVATPSGAPIGQFDQILGKSGLTNFSDRVHRLSNVEPGADTITSIIFYIIDLLKYFIGTVAVLFVIISGLKLITAEKRVDEVTEKEKENLKYIVYGLIIIMIADQLVSKVFFGEYGECVASASNAQDCATAGSSIVKTIYSFILAIIATLAVFILALAGFRMVTAYGEEETISKEKKRIAMALVGLIVAGLGEFIVKGIVFQDGGSKAIDLQAAQKLLYSFTNFIAGFIGVGAFIMLFYAGYLYVTAAGEEEQTSKAKKIITSAVIGLIIAAAAYGIVVTITSFSSGREVNLPSNLPGLPGK